MKYLILATSVIALLLIIVKVSFFPPINHSSDKTIIISREMRNMASLCATLTSDQIKIKRLEFLEKNKTATIEDLVKAIEAKIDGKNVIEFLESLKGNICREYIDSVKTDYENGKKAMESNYGGVSIETVMYWRLL